MTGRTLRYKKQINIDHAEHLLTSAQWHIPNGFNLHMVPTSFYFGLLYLPLCCYTLTWGLSPLSEPWCFSLILSSYSLLMLLRLFLIDPFHRVFCPCIVAPGRRSTYGYITVFSEWTVEHRHHHRVAVWDMCMIFPSVSFLCITMLTISRKKTRG